MSHLAGNPGAGRRTRQTYTGPEQAKALGEDLFISPNAHPDSLESRVLGNWAPRRVGT